MGIRDDYIYEIRVSDSGKGDALAPAAKQSQSPATLLLPHECETELEVMRQELADELTGPWLGFGRKLANEAARWRLNITRFRQALNVSAWRESAPRRTAAPPDYSSLLAKRAPIEDFEKYSLELEASVKSWRPPPVPPKLEHLARALQPLLDSETRRYEDNVSLVYHLLYAAQRLSEMEHQAIAANQKGGGAHARKEPVIGPQSNYVDDQNRLTRQGWRIIGDPLVEGEDRVEYEAAVVDIFNMLGNSIVSKEIRLIR